MNFKLHYSIRYLLCLANLATAAYFSVLKPQKGAGLWLGFAGVFTIPWILSIYMPLFEREGRNYSLHF